MGARTTIGGGRVASCFVLALAVLELLAVVSAPGAFGRIYLVHVCTMSPNGGAGGELELAIDPGTVGFGVVQTCNTSFPRVLQFATGDSVTGGSRWTLRAPPGTIIRTLSGIRQQSVWESPDIVWEIRTGTDRLERIASMMPEAPVQYTVNSNLVFASLQCARRPCLPPPGQAVLHADMSLRDIVAAVDDSLPPAVAIGPLPGAGPVRGVIEIPFAANDEGSGVAAARLLVDGDAVASVLDSNDGKCVAPFRFMAPCKPELNSSIPLNTTRLRDGSHDVKVIVSDGSGQEGSSAPISIDVRNAPGPAGPPPPTADPPHDLDRTAPALSGVSLSRKRSRVLLRFSSSEVGTLSLAIARARKGAKPIATFTRSISAGRGRVPLSGRIGNKPLRPGRYMLTLSARDAAGNSSKSVRLAFAIRPR